MPYDIEYQIKDFKDKIKLVVGGQMTESPATILYASDVSREIAQIALLIAALNDLEAKLGNILNVYIQAIVTGKGVDHLGPDFDKDATEAAVIENYIA